MFYIKPPVGQISLHVLEDCVITRLDYLKHVYHSTTNDFSGKFEYLLENSNYDRIGHFTLRLLASTSSDLLTYWIVRETLLLKHRLNCISPRQLYRLFRSIVRQLKTHEWKDELINRTLSDICTFYLQSSVFKHIVSNSHDKYCKRFHFEVRFQLVPDLIKIRKLDLREGYAITYCSLWKRILVSLFSTYVRSEIMHIKLQAHQIIRYDIRFNILSEKIRFQVFKEHDVGLGRITSSNIDAEAQNFPLCMQHLHFTLRNKHRLSHYARLYYSLFLKECGMKLEDSIDYWRTEYSKPHTCASGCSHNWQTNKRRFTYSIRHLYGLEGSRQHYKSPNCYAIHTGKLGPMYEGGCPFKNFDKNTLKTLLCNQLTEDKATKFLEVTANETPERSCISFLKMTHKIQNSDITVTSPTQYYFVTTNE